jgi:hypothetical protein
MIDVPCAPVSAVAMSQPGRCEIRYYGRLKLLESESSCVGSHGGLQIELPYS